MQKRNAPPVARIDTHEMMKSQIREENVVIHQPSGFAELKYQDEWCEDADGNPTAKFGGRSGREVGIFGEQPTIASRGGRPKTLQTINAEVEEEKRVAIKNAETILIDEETGEPIPEDEIDNYLTEFMVFAEGEKARDERSQGLMIENNLMTEDSKILLEDIKKAVEHFYLKDRKKEELPADTDPELVWFRDAYLLFDTRYRDLTFDQIENTGQFRWGISNIPFLQADGQVGVIFELEDIVELAIEEFSIPLDNTFNNFYGLVSLFIDEIATQAVMSSENTRYHFMLRTIPDGNRLRLVPTRDRMIFKNPIRYLTQTTFTFSYPFEHLPFCQDRMSATSTPGTNPALWTTVEPHCLSTNDLVYFTGADTGDPVINSELNDRNGLAITKINATQFTVPVDFTTVATPVLTVPYFGSKRLIIRIRARCLSRGEETNFMKAVGEHISFAI